MHGLAGFGQGRGLVMKGDVFLEGGCGRSSANEKEFGVTGFADKADIRDALLRHHSRSFVQVVNYGASWPEGEYPLLGTELGKAKIRANPLL